MKSSLFPDVNVWLALTHERHAHHPAARSWLESQDGDLFFCRFTQLGLLRLLTIQQVMGPEVLTQVRAWSVFRRWLADERVHFHREPETDDFERLFERLSSRERPSTKVWADAYLVAFARTAGLQLVSFDQGVKSLAPSGVALILE